MEDEDLDLVQKRKIVEAALFMAGKALTIKEITNYVNLSRPEVKAALKELMAEYASRDSSLEIVREEGEVEKYKMKVRDAYLSRVKEFSKLTDISEGEAKTLSLVALYQPVMQSYVIKIRGNKAYDQLRSLEGAGYVRSEPSGRTKLLKITQKVVDYFGASQIEEMRKSIDKSGGVVAADLGTGTEVVKAHAAVEVAEGEPEEEAGETGEEAEEAEEGAEKEEEAGEGEVDKERKGELGEELEGEGEEESEESEETWEGDKANQFEKDSEAEAEAEAEKEGEEEPE